MLENKIAKINIFSAACLSGAGLGLFYSPTVKFLFVYLVFQAGFFLLTLYLGGRSLAVFFLTAMIFLASFWRTIPVMRAQLPLEPATLTGYVVEPPLILPGYQLISLKTKLGIISVKTERLSEYSYGDRLVTFGTLKQGRVGLSESYPKIVRMSGREANPLSEALFRMRVNFSGAIERILPQPHSSIASGVLIGATSLRDSGLRENLRRTGTSHIVSVSGYNVSTIISFLIMLSSSVLLRAIYPFLILIVTLFSLMVGFSPPILRASIMGLFLLSAKVAGRQQNITDAFLLSAAIIVFLDPESLRSVSFQLSFLATFGIIYFYPFLLKAFLKFPAFPSKIAQVLAATLAAQLATLPVSIANFRTFSLISPLTNVLVYWTVGPIMLLSFLVGLVGQASFLLGQIVAALDWVLLDYFIRVVNLTASFSWSSFSF